MPPQSSPPTPAPPPPYPLYNTTYTLHRLSPLHSLPPSSLPTHSAALHEILTGSTLRGVRIGLDTTSSDTSLSRAGALRSVSMRPLRSPDSWAAVYGADDTVLEAEGGEGWGVLIEISYERAEYTAILLGDIKTLDGTIAGPAVEGEFTHLPLLLTRLQPPLRTTILEFLATRFDTHASPLHLSSPFLKKALGGYMDALVRGGGDVGGVVRDVVVSLSFPGVEGGELKGIDVTIAREDVPRFLERGRSTNTTAGEATGEHEHPFWTALHKYTATHLALDLSVPGVAVTKIACGAFVMAKEGRVKVSAPAEGEREAAEGVVGALVGAAGRVG